MAALYLLFESASGYALFSVEAMDEIGEKQDAVRRSFTDFTRFGKAVRLVSFQPFSSAVEALNQCNAISEGVMTEELRKFLGMSLAAVKEDRMSGFTLGVADSKLGSHIHEDTGIPCRCDDTILELFRGVRLHFDRFIDDLKPFDLEKAQLGLSHSYSRSKIKFNANKDDNMLIAGMAMLDTIDKDINLFSMRIREWYSWHFPELIKIVNDNYLYAKVTQLVDDKSSLSVEDKVPQLIDVLGDEDKANEIVEASKKSMGPEMSPIDLINVKHFSQKVIYLSEYRKTLSEYIVAKMNDIAPNLSCLIGDVVGARLISRAGSLSSLAKCPSSTLQILGAEKALFRALKTRGNTPKYGLIFHSSFIGRASARNKGRLARYLANKCSIASRIDCFSEINTSIFGEKLREQVEERLDFYDKGVAPRKNIDVMKSAMEIALKGSEDYAQKDSGSSLKKKSKKKHKGEAVEAVEPMEEDKPSLDDVELEPGLDKKKSKKKHKGEAMEAVGPMEEDKPSLIDVELEPGLDKKKSKKKHKGEAMEAVESMEEDKRSLIDVELEPGLDKKKSKKKHKVEAMEAIETMEEDKASLLEAEPEHVLDKKKKKKKSKHTAEQEQDANDHIFNGASCLDSVNHGSRKKKKHENLAGMEGQLISEGKKHEDLAVLEEHFYSEGEKKKHEDLVVISEGKKKKRHDDLSGMNGKSFPQVKKKKKTKSADE